MNELKIDKTAFLVCYDYGMGGLWATVLARTRDEILKKYPELVVFSGPAEWMKPSDYQRILAKTPVDIDDVPTGILETVLKDRTKQ